MRDTLGREITYLRISLTDRCNLRCVYCMPPEGVNKREHREILSLEEMEEIGYEDCFYGDGVCLIEWSRLIGEILPENIIQVEIEKDLEKGFEYRRVTIKGM